MPNWKGLIALVVVATLLGVAYFWKIAKVEKKAVDEHEAENYMEEKMFTFDRAQAVKLSMLGTKRTIVLERVENSDDWRIIEPRSYPASKQDVDSLLSQLENLHAERILDEKPADDKLYGLEKPQMKIAWRVRSSAPEPAASPAGKGTPAAKKATPVTEELALVIGDKAPTETSVYARKLGETRVYSLGNWVFANFDKDVPDLRDKAVLTFQQPEVKRVKLIRRDVTIDLVRKGADQWVMGAPLNVTAAASWMNLIFSNLSGLRVNKFVEDNAKNPAKYGMSNPKLKVEITLEKDRKLPVVTIGNEVESDRYFMRSGDPNVYSMFGTTFDNIHKDPVDLRDKQLFYFDINEPEEIRIELDGKGLTYLKKDGHWSSPQAPKAPSTQAVEFLTKLKSFYADKWNSRSGGDLAAQGLSRPKTRVTVRLPGRGRSVSLAIGKKIEGQELYYFRLGDESWTGQLPASVWGDIDMAFHAAFATPTPVAIGTPGTGTPAPDATTDPRKAPRPILQVMPRTTPSK